MALTPRIKLQVLQGGLTACSINKLATLPRVLSLVSDDPICLDEGRQGDGLMKLTPIDQALLEHLEPGCSAPPLLYRRVPQLLKGLFDSVHHLTVKILFILVHILHLVQPFPSLCTNEIRCEALRIMQGI